MASTRQEDTGSSSQQVVHRAYLLTGARTASNLFVKILNLKEQPNAATQDEYGGYFFMSAIRHQRSLDLWDTPFDALSERDKKSIGDKYQQGIDRFRHFLESAPPNRIAFVKEHVFCMTRPTVCNEIIHGVGVPHPSDTIETPAAAWTPHMDESTDIFTPGNPLIVPDNVLSTFHPTFLIRHPAIQFPSMHRAKTDLSLQERPSSAAAFNRFIYNMSPTRQLYNLYVTHLRTATIFNNNDDTGDNGPQPPAPLVIDAADLIAHPESVMRHYCHLVGFDFSKCKFNWDSIPKESQEKMNPYQKRFLDTLNDSKGIVSDKANVNVDIDVEARKWRDEFGDEVGGNMEMYVRAAMPDYEYLWERRWRP